MAEKTLFQKIIDREEPAEFLYEDETYVIIKNKYPSAPIHYLIIPRKPIPSVAGVEDTDAELIGNMFVLAKKFIAEHNIENFKLTFNGGKYLHIPHLHLHLLAGDDLHD